MNILPNKFYILDTETTGLGDNDEIIEITLINQGGEAVLNTLIKPTQPIPAEAVAIHGITDEMVADAPTWAEIYPTLTELCHGKDIFIYNAKFDLRLWRQSTNRYFCTYLEKPIFNEKTRRKISFNAHCVMNMVAERIYHYHRVSLANASEHYDVTFDGLTPHRAASDCAVTLDLLRAMYGLDPIATGEFARKYEVVL